MFSYNYLKDWHIALYKLFWLQVLEQRVETLERELDASISAAARARTEKRHAEAAQKAAELRAQEITRELENTSSMFLWFLSFDMLKENLIATVLY